LRTPIPLWQLLAILQWMLFLLMEESNSPKSLASGTDASPTPEEEEDCSSDKEVMVSLLLFHLKRRFSIDFTNNLFEKYQTNAPHPYLCNNCSDWMGRIIGIYQRIRE